jgi:hypothetical protein
VVTLIEIRDVPTILFEYQPISWHLFNTFVELSEQKNARSHGNYTPAILTAFQHLQKTANEQCALTLFFLTDGKPSDLSRKIQSFPYWTSFYEN